MTSVPLDGILVRLLKALALSTSASTVFQMNMLVSITLTCFWHTQYPIIEPQSIRD